jgi:drug/metabolite transporter (DMT)-like permease
MLYLLLAIFGAVYLAVVLKWSEARRRSRMTVMAANYLAATALSGGYFLWVHGVPPGPATVLWGSATGLVYAASLLLWMVVIRHAGVGASTAAMRLSVVWPALISALVFGEALSAWQGLGVALALAAVLLLALRSGLAPLALHGSGPGWLIALFVTSGMCGSFLKLFHQWGAPDEREAYLVLIFLSAGIICWGWVAWRRRRRGERLHGPDVRNGLLFGVGNVLGNGFLLKSLETVPGVLAFPLRDSACIVIVSGIGVVVWRERPGRLGTVALAAAAAAVVLMVL